MPLDNANTQDVDPRGPNADHQGATPFLLFPRGFGVSAAWPLEVKKGFAPRWYTSRFDLTDQLHTLPLGISARGSPKLGLGPFGIDDL